MARVRALAAVIVIGMLLGSSAGAGTSSARTSSTASVQNGQRALVLGGGGMTARGWELGMLKGLQDAGLDVSRPDLLVGTSAGAVLGVQLQSGRMVEALHDALPNPAGSPPAPSGSPPFDPAYAEETRQMWTSAVADTAARRAEVGQRALAAPRVISEETHLQTFVNALADNREWPTGLLTVPVVDVDDGTVRFLDRTSGVPIERALAAGTALPGRVAPIAIGDRRYMDGGVAGTNLDGAAGYGVVLAITPGVGPKTDQELATLHSQGSRVLVIAPDADSEAARGPDSGDLSRVRPAAEAGYRQAAAVVAEVRDLWAGGDESR
jgi:NTE family protein